MKSKGFTLVELVMVIVLIGLLAIGVMPRFFERRTFDVRGFHDETMAALRYAQKVAVAQRRTACVAFSANSVTLTIASTAGASACPADLPLPGPTGASPFEVAGHGDVAFAATPSDFSFNALGQPSIGQTIQVAGAAQRITIEQETGYVHQ